MKSDAKLSAGCVGERPPAAAVSAVPAGRPHHGGEHVLRPGVGPFTREPLMGVPCPPGPRGITRPAPCPCPRASLVSRAHVASEGRPIADSLPAPTNHPDKQLSSARTGGAVLSLWGYQRRYPVHPMMLHAESAHRDVGQRGRQPGPLSNPSPCTCPVPRRCSGYATLDPHPHPHGPLFTYVGISPSPDWIILSPPGSQRRGGTEPGS